MESILICMQWVDPAQASCNIAGYPFYILDIEKNLGLSCQKTFAGVDSITLHCKMVSDGLCSASNVIWFPYGK